MADSDNEKPNADGVRNRNAQQFSAVDLDGFSAEVRAMFEQKQPRRRLSRQRRTLRTFS